MKTMDLETAASEIQQACEDEEEGRLSYFFLVGAGISYPPVDLAPAIEDACRVTAHKYKRTDEPSSKLPIDTYSHWFDKAYPQPSQRQKYLRDLIKDKNISQANFRLAHLLLKKKITNLVVTPNFDDFLLRALTLFGKQPIVCDHPAMVERVILSHMDEIQIVHVHGTYSFYDCCNLRDEITTRAESSSQTTATMAALLDSILMNRVPLVLGYSGWEGDVFMMALERRLKNRRLPYRLYWFCYKQEATEMLPDWLKSHADVHFVMPTPKPATPSSGERIEYGDSPKSQMKPPPQGDGQIASGASSENVLMAQQVLDRLIQTFALEAPTLTSDPLQFLADHLRASLPKAEKNQPEDSVYRIKKVIERIEMAKQREQEELQTQVSESQLEQVRDALRRSQYGEAIKIGGAIDLDNMTDRQLLELLEAAEDAATMLGDDSAEELSGHELVLSIGAILKARDIEDPVWPRSVASALISKGVVLGQLSRDEEAIASYDEAINRFGETKDPNILVNVALALVNKGEVLDRLDRKDEEIVIYDQVIQRFGKVSEPEMQINVATALVYKGVVLDKLKRSEEAIATYDEVIKRFGETTDNVLRVYVISASFNKGVVLHRLHREEEAIACYSELLRDFGEATELYSRTLIAKTLVNKGMALNYLKQEVGAIANYDETINRFDKATEMELRAQVAKAMVNKSMALIQLKRDQEAFDNCREVIARFDAETEPALRNQVGFAFNFIGFGELCAAKKLLLEHKDEEAHTKLAEAQGLITSALERSPDNPFALGNEGYIAFLSGDKEKARALLTQAIELGGEEVRRGELSDADIHTLPQDEEFRELVRSIPVTAED
jgi:tetratricopeptide (TPR) repeat protein